MPTETPSRIVPITADDADRWYAERLAMADTSALMVAAVEMPALIARSSWPETRANLTRRLGEVNEELRARRAMGDSGARPVDMPTLAEHATPR